MRGRVGVMKPGQQSTFVGSDLRWRSSRTQVQSSGISDPFAVNPIRRAAALVAVCAVALVGPWLISEQLGITMMLAVGWLAVTGLVLGLPILIWCLGEEALSAAQRRRRPGVDLLGLSPRVEHILVRHGLTTIRSIEATPDDGLLLLSNMDQRGVAEVRRATTLWKYRRWQESGFTVVGNE